MKCEKCQKNEASVFYREIINGKETRLTLCPACAREREEESGLSFKSLFSNSLFKSSFPQVVTEKEKCPLCGLTSDDVARLGKVGCPACYGAFEAYLAPNLRRLHGSVVHRGRAPARLRQERKEKSEIEKLEGELRASIEKEDYENAARLRDKIREMRNGGAL